MINSEKEAIKALTPDGRAGIWRKRQTLDINPEILENFIKEGLIEERVMNGITCYRYTPTSLKIKNSSEEYLKQLIA